MQVDVIDTKMCACTTNVYACRFVFFVVLGAHGQTLLLRLVAVHGAGFAAQKNVTKE